MRPVPIGRLRHRITLEDRTATPSGADTLTIANTAVATVWGDISAVGGALYAAGVQTEAKITHRITIRARALTNFDQVSKGARRFRVRETRDPDGTRRFVELLVEELTP